MYETFPVTKYKVKGPGSSVGLATVYCLDGPGIESKEGKLTATWLKT
jgi:hypothetical protein